MANAGAGLVVLETEPKLVRTKVAWHLLYALVRVGQVWFELWLPPVLGLATMNRWAALVLCVVLWVRWRERIAQNPRDTWQVMFETWWRIRSVSELRFPKLEGLDMGSFIGWKQTRRRIFGHKKSKTPRSGWRTVPWTSLSPVLRHIPSLADSPFAEKFPSYLQAFWRMQKATPKGDPSDTNRMIIVLAGKQMASMVRLAPNNEVAA